MTPRWAVSIIPFLAATSVTAADRASVEIRRVGDDGLTVKFSERLEDAFRSSSAFVLSDDKVSNHLAVTIPENLHWKMVGSRLQFDYNVEFKIPSSERLGNSKGVCWEDEMLGCAKHVLQDAARFVAR